MKSRIQIFELRLIECMKFVESEHDAHRLLLRKCTYLDKEATEIAAEDTGICGSRNRIRVNVQSDSKC